MATPSLSTAQQARLTSGKNFWQTKPEAGLPSIAMTDGPNGLRKQEGSSDALGLSQCVPATCFPPAVGLSQTWNPDLAARIGAAIGTEALARQVSVVLGPGVNLKRSPLGGRNFEYYSEDPVLSGAFGEAWVRGVQSVNVGASLKHFAANNQETDRMRVSAAIDERTLHELYLRAFEHIVRTARPWTVMCSYNRINGTHASENRELLTEILRDAWGFDGVVVSDWGAVVDRVRSVAAGLDLMMPFGGDELDNDVAAAVEDGRLNSNALSESADRMIALVERAAPHIRSENGTFDVDSHHALAREAAAQAIVLLRNDGDLLPFDSSESVAVIGAMATEPRYQGGGSSKVNATKVDIPLDEIKKHAGTDVAYAAGYTTDGDGSSQSSELISEAVTTARAATNVVLFLGLAGHQESEGFDRTTIDLPSDQLELAQAVLTANPRTAVVLSRGGVLRVDPLLAPAILDGALLGQAGGGAIADVLFGTVNPSGKLSETIPLRLEDNPSYLNFPGEFQHVTYGEGLFIGYRWYDARTMNISYPFGHGLSYTRFDYRDLSVTTTADGLDVEVTIANVGQVDGREVVQIYTAIEKSEVSRPVRELKAFASVEVKAGEQERVTIRVPREVLAYWDVRVHGFVVEGATYRVEAGASSRDIRLHTDVEIRGDEVTIPLTTNSPISEVVSVPSGKEALADLVTSSFPDLTEDDGPGLLAMIGSVPVDRLPEFTTGTVTKKALEDKLKAINSSND